MSTRINPPSITNLLSEARSLARHVIPEAGRRRLRKLLRREVRVIPSPYGSATPHYDAVKGLFVFTGSYRNIGLQFATAVPPHENLERARVYYRNQPPDRRRDLDGRIDASMDLLAKSCAPILELLKGVQEACAEYTLKDVVFANFCTVLADWKTYWACSAIAFRSRSGCVLGQNLDLGPTNATSVALLLPDDGSACLVHMNPGYVWFTVGINEHGLCIGGSSTNVSGIPGTAGTTLPNEFMLLFLLCGARNVDGAIGLLENGPCFGPLNGGNNIVLMDRANRLANVEVAFGRVSLNRNEGRAAIATNHYRTEHLAPYNRLDNRYCRSLMSNSLARHERAMKWLAEAPPDADRLRRLLGESGGDGEWCRNAVAADIGYTSASYIFDLERGVAEFKHGVMDSKPVRREIDLECVFRRELPPTV